MPHACLADIMARVLHIIMSWIGLRTMTMSCQTMSNEYISDQTSVGTASMPAVQ